MTDVKPALVKDAFTLQREDGFFDKNAPIYAEPAGLAVIAEGDRDVDLRCQFNSLSFVKWLNFDKWYHQIISCQIILLELQRISLMANRYTGQFCAIIGPT